MADFYIFVQALMINMKSRTIIIIIVIILVVILVLLFLKDYRKNMTTSLSGVPGIESEPPLILEYNNLSELFPSSTDTTPVISYTGFNLSYNEEFEQAAWVAYILTRYEVLGGTETRSENFRADTLITSKSASPSDYAKSGYDRGHLAPAADMKWSPSAMSESFLMSNMSPQLPGFNRGVWSRLETKVREWAVQNDSILVITGPVLSDIDDYIGENRVGVPKAYFKVLADISPPAYKVIAFLLNNQSSTADLFTFAVSVDSLEMVTGYDFFSFITDQAMIGRMESGTNTGGWIK
jgi:endonuclease G